MDHAPAYGLWTLVAINSLVFILFEDFYEATQLDAIGGASAPSPRSSSPHSWRCTVFP